MCEVNVNHHEEPGPRVTFGLPRAAGYSSESHFAIFAFSSNLLKGKETGIAFTEHSVKIWYNAFCT